MSVVLIFNFSRDNGRQVFLSSTLLTNTAILFQSKSPEDNDLFTINNLYQYVVI